MNIQPEILQMAQQIWDYHQMNHELKKAEAIMVLGSHDMRVADRGAELFLEGMAPILIFSGGLGNFTREMWTTPEADLFAARAIELGVPESAIMVENKSTNTGENVQFTDKLLASKGLYPTELILVQKPYMERRTFATASKHWPGKKLMITSPQISLLNYVNDELPFEKVLNIMLGDLQRIREYPAKGFQIYQPIPEEVWESFEKLVALGYDKHLIKG